MAASSPRENQKSKKIKKEKKNRQLPGRLDKGPVKLMDIPIIRTRPTGNLSLIAMPHSKIHMSEQ